MSLESFAYIKDLVPSNPTGTDPKSQGDDHLRGVKQTLKNQFPGFTLGKPITVNEDVINALATPVAPPSFRGVRLNTNNSPYAEVINWKNEEYDTDNAFSLATPDRIIIPAGIVRASLHMQYVANNIAAGASFTTYVYKNGVNFSGGPQQTIKNFGTGTLNANFNYASGWLAVTPGDYFQIWVQVAPTSQNSGNVFAVEFSAT